MNIEQKNKKEYETPKFDWWSSDMLDVIEAKMSGGGSILRQGASSLYPVIAEPEEFYTWYVDRRNYMRYWIKCTAFGAVDIEVRITGGVSGVTIFNAINLIAPPLFSMSSVSGSTVYTRGYHQWGTYTYMINFSNFSPDSGTAPMQAFRIMYRVKTVVDTAVRPYGTIWMADRTVEGQEGWLPCTARIFLTHNDVVQLKAALADDDFLDDLGLHASGGTGVILAATSTLVGGLIGFVIGVAFAVFYLFGVNPYDFRDQFNAQINNATGTSGGIRFEVSASVQGGDMGYFVSSWFPSQHGGTVTGYSGVIGNFFDGNEVTADDIAACLL